MARAALTPAARPACRGPFVTPSSPPKAQLSGAATALRPCAVRRCRNAGLDAARPLLAYGEAAARCRDGRGACQGGCAAAAAGREFDEQHTRGLRHGHYTRGFVHSQSGDPLQAIASADHSREQSPYDPRLFAMLGARSIALMRLGRHDEAVKTALEAADRLNAHVHILAIAAHALGLAGRDADARRFVARIREAVPGYRSADFTASFHFADDAQVLMRGVAKRIGLVD